MHWDWSRDEYSVNNETNYDCDSGNGKNKTESRDRVEVR